MDDPNNPSIPASNAFPTPESAVPEMPMPGPITTSTTTSTPTSTTTSTTTTTPPTPDLLPVLPMAPEAEWPGSKPKSKMPQILGGIAAIILVVGVATAAYFVSNKISGRQAVAPTAPESEPLAAKGKEEEEVKKKWEKPAIDEKGRPRQTEETSERVAASSACPQGCGSGEVCTDKGCRKAQAAPTGYGTGYTCTSSNCPGPCFSCNASNTSCIAHRDVPGCGEVSESGKSTATQTVTATTTTAPTAAPGTVVATLPPAKEYCVGSETCEAGDSCFQNFCRTYPSSHVVRTRSDGKGGSITFDYGGKIISYTGSTCPSGETVSNKTGKCESLIGLEICTYGQDCSDIEVPSGSTRCINNAIKTSFCCPPGVIIRNGSCTSGGGGTTTTTTKKTGGGEGESGAQSATSCTEQCPGGDGVLRSCTPPEADGSSNDSLCNSAGRVESCGGNNYCCPSAGGAWTTDMTACPTTTTVTAGACYDVALFAKVAGVYSTTPMTVAQKASLHVGDMIRIAITGSKADLKARFRVYINEVVEPTGNTASPEWRLGQTFSGADHKTTFYSDYEIKSAGNYKFEGQVTTEP